MKSVHLLAASAIAALIAPTLAPAQTSITGIRDIDEEIDDARREAERDLARAEDQARFGNPEFRPGLSGSASLGYSGVSGAVDTQELTFGARLRHANGPFVQTLGALLEFSEADGVRSEEDVFVIYDAQYYLNDRFYVFGLGRVVTDGLADEADETAVDGFLGVGPGFRIVNTPDVAWRVQAGVGISYLRDGLEDSETEAGAIASSRLYWRVSDAVFITNDTDVLNSDTALRASNDFGVSFQISDQFSTRLSYLTDYNESRAERTENKVGLSLVYGF